MNATKRGYGGISSEERRATRRVALMDAALDLLTESGVRGVTKKAVCARARLNDRYFYEQFDDAEALLEAVANDMTAAGLRAVATATLQAPADVRARIHAAADAAIEFVVADPRRSNILLISHTDAVLQRIRLDSTRAIVRSMSAMTRDLLGESAPSQLDTDLAAFTIVTGVMELVAAWMRGEFDTSRAHLADVVAAMLMTVAEISTTIPASGQ
ncbi:TetR/AcrR family transcriptional regulator [Mycolicibacterium sp. P9-64]|uniref:TetR/AcrR family transcriptional regulator n=1 Tax=Mycolicibacterium sp. P9-64 TaxID=2024612 RepID=UPI001566C224|nr:TetR/AcrR family transcriptional regulator [Mycolicibacterium sp. P9-64]